MKDRDAPHITPYTKPAAGWDALKHVAISLRQERVAPGNLKALLAQNQPDGFDCPGCAWPDRNHASTFAFCENGTKAVAAEATSRRTGPDLFANTTVTQLLEQSDYALEQHGRLTEPMAYDAGSDRYVPIAGNDAYAPHLRRPAQLRADGADGHQAQSQPPGHRQGRLAAGPPWGARKSTCRAAWRKA